MTRMRLLGPPNFWVAVLALQKPLLDFFFIGIETFFLWLALNLMVIMHKVVLLPCALC